MKKLLFSIILSGSALIASAQNGIITNIAGNTINGYITDGVAATSTPITNTEGIAIDHAGNLYIANFYGGRIRKVTPAGIISTIAGNGTSGVGAESVPATSTAVDAPLGICVDGAGNVYFTELYNNRVRKVSTAGIITTVAGTGVTGYTGDNGPATAATFNYLCDVKCDVAGNLYVADCHNDAVRKISTTGIITAFAGPGGGVYSGDGGPATAAGMGRPYGLWVDDTGNVYITYPVTHQLIRKVNTAGIITRFAGAGGGSGFAGDGGLATGAMFNSPGYITMDSCGNMYISDQNNYRIRKISSSGMVSTVTGNGSPGYTASGSPAIGAMVNITTGLAIDSAGNLIYADNDNYVVRKITYNLTSVNAITGLSNVCMGNTISLSSSTLFGSWSSGAAGIATVDAAGVVTGLSTGTAIITYSFTNSCNAIPVVSDTQMITVNTLPVVHITGPALICGGGHITLTDTNPGGIWASSLGSVATVNSSGMVTGITLGSTIISYTVTNLCGTTTDTQAITVVVLPDPGTLSGNIKVCVGNTISLTPSVGGGTWSSSNTALALVNTSGVVTGVAPGAVVISYTLTNACGPAAATHNVTVNPIDSCNTGIPNTEQSTAINIYPNPNDGTFTISLPIAANEATISIIDVLGRVIDQRNVQHSSISDERFILQNVAPGRYFIKVVIGEKIYVERIEVNSEK